MISNRFASRNGRRAFLTLCAAFLAGASAPGAAHEDHDQARQALEAGEVLPLRNILERVEREYPGQVVDVELEREDGYGGVRWVYKIKVLRSGGSLVKLKVDARDGTIIGRKARDATDGNDARRPRRSGEGS